MSVDPELPGRSRGRLTGNAMWWLILAGLSSWSYMAVWSANAKEVAGFSFGHYAAWVSSFFVVVAAVRFGASRLLGSRANTDRSFAVASIVVIFLQSWNSRLTTGLGLGLRLSLYIAIVAFTIAITIRLTGVFPHVRAVFGVLTVFLVGVPYLTALEATWNALTSEPPPLAAASPLDSSAPHRDVFVLILDEYTSSSVLEADFGFDNSVFEESLEANDVRVVNGARSNYTDTGLSVGGLLAGRYPAVGGPGDVTYEEMISIHSGNNPLFASLDEAGYETHLFDNAWTFTRCGPNVDICHDAGLDELDWLVAARTPFRDLLPWLQLSPWLRASLDQLTEATHIAGTDSETPRLVYLHALIPHAPLQLDANCSERLPGFGTLEGVTDSDQARTAYIEQVQCINGRVVEFVASIPDDSVVMITGDHGVRWAAPDASAPDLSSDEVERLFGVLTAFRFPEQCEPLTPGASLEQSAAGFFACLGIETDQPSSHDASQPARFFDASLGVDGTYRMTEVTERVTTSG